jgi:hypothetical protein
VSAIRHKVVVLWAPSPATAAAHFLVTGVKPSILTMSFAFGDSIEPEPHSANPTYLFASLLTHSVQHPAGAVVFPHLLMQKALNNYRLEDFLGARVHERLKYVQGYWQFDGMIDTHFDSKEAARRQLAQLLVGLKADPAIDQMLQEQAAAKALDDKLRA